MAYPNYRSQFGDTTYTKVFVGGLAWETPTDKMRRYFEQFGEILEAVVITDKVTGRSKGYGFVTFRDPDSARKACEEPNPVIDGRKANCNVAALGRPRPSPPRVLNAGGRTQGVNPYHGAGPQGAPVFNQVGAPLSPQPPMPAQAAPVIYPPYGYTTYTPEYGYHHTLYNPHIQAQYYQHQQMYGTSSSAVGSPYYYGYNSLQASPSHRGGPAYTATQAQLSRAPFYMHYPAQGEGPFTMLPQPTAGPALTRQQQSVPPSSSSPDSQSPAQESSTTGGMGVSNISESQ